LASTEITVARPAGLERSQTRGLAFAVGFFCSFRFSIVLLSVRLLGLEPGTGSVLSLGLNLTLFLLICFASAAGRPCSIRSILRLPTVRWVLFFLALSLLSLAWSETASFTNSFAYWLGLAIDVANVVLLLRSEFRANDALALMEGFIWSSGLLAAMAWAMPVQADLRLGDEEFFNTNEIANLCAFALLFAQYLTRLQRGRWRFPKFLLVITLFRSLSKSTIISFLVGEGFLLIADRSISRKKKLLLVCGTLAVCLLFFGLFQAYYVVYTNAGNQAETLTGRTAIWLYVFNAAIDHPWTLWIGHGFDSWWKVVPPFGDEMFSARHAENELLQQFYAYGIAGVAMLTGVYVSLLRQIRKLKHATTRVLFQAMLIFVVVRGLAVADSFDLLLPLWAIVLMSVMVDCGSTVNFRQA
jgi:exopolysaccharide production protein ExoQ